MSADRNYIVDIFDDVVSRVRAEYDSSNIKPIYDYNHPLAEIKELSERSKGVNKDKKYPLVLLNLDISENHGTNNQLQYELSAFTVYLIVDTKKEYTSRERYDYSFKPILYPIYQLFIDSIIKEHAFFARSRKDIPHTKTDRVYWGTNTPKGVQGHIFNDYLDAIELNFNAGLKVMRQQKECTRK